MAGKQGFASMDPQKQRAIAAKGGRRAHEVGTAHEWTKEEAAAAGRKGGIKMHQRLKESKHGEEGNPNPGGDTQPTEG